MKASFLLFAVVGLLASSAMAAVVPDLEATESPTESPTTTTTATTTTTKSTTSTTQASTTYNCPAVFECGCPRGSVENWERDAHNCWTCSCQVETTTTQAPTTTTNNCPALDCVCDANQEVVKRYPTNGACPYCFCRNLPGAESSTTTTTRAPTTTTYRADTTATTRVSATTTTSTRAPTTASTTRAPATTTQRSDGCLPLDCICNENEELMKRNPAGACAYCFCRPLSTSTRPDVTTTRAPTTTTRAPSTTTYRADTTATTRAPASATTTARPASTTTAGCLPLDCICNENEELIKRYPAGDCAYCFCRPITTSAPASTTTRVPTTTATSTRVPSTTAATTTRAQTTTSRALETTATRPAQTETLAGCQPVNCRCQQGEEVVNRYPAGDCAYCFCRPARLPTTTATAAASSSTRAATTTARVVCPTVQVPNCREGLEPYYDIDANGCILTGCKPVVSTTTATTQAPTRPTTQAPTTRVPTTVAPTCPTFRQCRCPEGAKAVSYYDENNCERCACKIVDTEAPTTTSAAPTTTPCPEYRVCRCREGTASYDYIDAYGCVQCGCGVISTTPAFTTRVPATTTTTPRAATATAAYSCPTERMCYCRAEAVAVWDVDANNCRVCSCKIRADSSYLVGAETAPSSAGAGVNTTTLAVALTASAFVVLLVAAAVITYKRHTRRTTITRTTENNAQLSWDDEGLRGESAQ